MHTFWMRTLLRGMSVVLPLCLVAFLVAQVTETLRPYVEAIAAALPFALAFPGNWAIAWTLVLLLLVCLAAGLVLDLPPVRRLVATAQTWLVRRSPTYAYLRGIEGSIASDGRQQLLQAALADLDEGMASLAFVTEELADGRYVVFVPSTPSARDGSVYIMARKRVHLIDANARQVLPCIRLWGLGAGELLDTPREPL